MRIELSDKQVQALVQILQKYYNGQVSVAAEAPTLMELAKAIQTPVTETKAPSEVKETKTDGNENKK